MWIVAIFAAMTAIAVLAILAPLNRRRGDESRAEAHDVEVYHAQLMEIDADVARGAIEPAEAEAAQTEIARRLIAANRRVVREGALREGQPLARAATIATIIVVPTLALGLYAIHGAPNMPDRPLSARLSAPPETQTLAELVARIETRLAENPEDGRGWEILAPIYMRMNRPLDAANAYAAASRLLGPTASFEADRGEALVAANQGTITQAAHDAFEQAAALDPTSVKPRFYLAMALGQDGKTEDAVAAWHVLLAEANGDEPWTVAARDELRRLNASRADPASRGPTAADVEAARTLSDDDREQMISGMVENLRLRLEREGGSLEEWLRLVQSYRVLGRTDEARAAVAAARAAFADDPNALAALALELGE